MESIKKKLLLELKNEKISLHKWLLLINITIVDFLCLMSSSWEIAAALSISYTLVSGFFLLPHKISKSLFYAYNRQILAFFMAIAHMVLIYSFYLFIIDIKLLFFLYFLLLLWNTLFYRGNTLLYSVTFVPSLLMAMFFHNEIEAAMFSTENITILIAVNLMMIIVHYFHFKYYLLHNEHIKFEHVQEKKAEKLSEDKNFLVKILCHDLGNSLTIIEVSISILESILKKQDKYSKKEQANIERCQRAVREQTEIINSVKQKITLESEHKVELIPVEIDNLIEKIQFNFIDKLKEKDLTLKINLNHQNKMILSEPVSLVNNVLNNLMANAIKFSKPSNEIEISTSYEKDYIKFTIQDHGIGMEKEYRDHIFSEYIKTTRPGTLGEKGTGYGLPLVKAFMASYQGKIEVESEIDIGSKFTLSFLEAK